MNTKTFLVALGLAVGLTVPLVAADNPENSAVEVSYVEPEKFTDVQDSFGASQEPNESYLRQLKEHLQRSGSKRLADGQRLTVTITDIDMAGDFEPWRSPQFQDVRIIKDIYPPRIDLSFQLIDANGQVIAEGERELRDLSFNMRTTGLPTNDTLRHEKALLDDWLRRELRRAKKS